VDDERVLITIVMLDEEELLGTTAMDDERLLITIVMLADE